MHSRTPKNQNNLLDSTNTIVASQKMMTTPQKTKLNYERSEGEISPIDLSKIRISQRNLVYILGLDDFLAHEDVLKRNEYFGQYGKISKVVIYRRSGSLKNKNNSHSAYVTFSEERDASLAIYAVDNVEINQKILRCCYGTTKYCSYFLSKLACPNKSQCLYLHYMCNEKDYLTFTSNGDNNYEQEKVVLSILRKYKKDFLKMKNEMCSANKESVFPPLIKVVIRLVDVFLEEDKKMENTKDKTKKKAPNQKTHHVIKPINIVDLDEDDEDTVKKQNIKSSNNINNIEAKNNEKKVEKIESEGAETKEKNNKSEKSDKSAKSDKSEIISSIKFENNGEKEEIYDQDILTNFHITDELERKIICNVLNDKIQRSRFSFVRSDDEKSDDLTHKSDYSVKEILLNSLTQRISCDFSDTDNFMIESLKRKFSMNNNDDLETDNKTKKINFYSYLNESKTEEKRKSYMDNICNKSLNEAEKLKIKIDFQF